MYLLGVKSKFDAAHFLCGYKGACANMHGHTWKVEVLLSSDTLDALGLAVDFKVIKRELGKITGEFDHAVLNGIVQGEALEPSKNPTAENLARWIYDRLRKLLENVPVVLKMVTVWESEDAWAAYTE